MPCVLGLVEARRWLSRRRSVMLLPLACFQFVVDALLGTTISDLDLVFSYTSTAHNDPAVYAFINKVRHLLSRSASNPVNAATASHCRKGRGIET